MAGFVRRSQFFQKVLVYSEPALDCLRLYSVFWSLIQPVLGRWVMSVGRREIIQGGALIGVAAAMGLAGKSAKAEVPAPGAMGTYSVECWIAAPTMQVTGGPSA